MVANEIFVNYYNFNPIWVQNASIHVRKYTDARVKKGNCQGMLLNLFSGGAGAGDAIRICGSAEPELEPDPKEIFSAPQHFL